MTDIRIEKKNESRPGVRSVFAPVLIAVARRCFGRVDELDAAAFRRAMRVMESAMRVGSVCVTLDAVKRGVVFDEDPEEEFFDVNADAGRALADVPGGLGETGEDADVLERLESLDEKGWLGVLERLREVRLLSPRSDAAVTPLVHDGDPDAPGDGTRLYTADHYAKEASLAASLARLFSAGAGTGAAALEDGKALVDEICGEIRRYGLHERQRAAVERALVSRLSIVSGGPGTGKTTTVVFMLEALLRARLKDGLGREGFVIALAAPTGKATQRMKESIEKSISEEGYADALRETRAFIRADAVRQEQYVARTIHKWLATRTVTGERPSPGNPLEADVLIVDEASMIDAHLAAELFSVIDPERTRVVLLGDKNQLAAVGPGAVFGELTQEGGPLSAGVTTLTESHRFREDSVIHTLAEAAKAGRADELVSAITAATGAGADKHGYTASLVTEEVNPRTGMMPGAEHWLEEKLDALVGALAAYRRETKGLLDGPAGEDDKAATKVLERARTRLLAVVGDFRALAAQRRGINSVEAVNAFARRRLEAKLLDEPLLAELLRFRQGGTRAGRDPVWRPGDLVIVRSNDDSIGIYNGDVGVFIPVEHHRADGSVVTRLEVLFENGRVLAHEVLPYFESAFAITIHQSQGSEFPDVAVFMPHDPSSSLATRELFYTGITRTKRNVVVYGSVDVVRRAVETPTVRMSGLTARLTEAVSENA